MDNPDNIKKEISRYKKAVVIDQKELDREKLAFINQIKSGYGNQIKEKIIKNKKLNFFMKLWFIIKQKFLSWKFIDHTQPDGL